MEIIVIILVVLALFGVVSWSSIVGFAGAMVVGGILLTLAIMAIAALVAGIHALTRK